MTLLHRTAPPNASGNFKNISTHLYNIQITTKAAYFNIQALLPCLSDHMLLPCGRYCLLLGKGLISSPGPLAVFHWDSQSLSPLILLAGASSGEQADVRLRVE